MMLIAITAMTRCGVQRSVPALIGNLVQQTETEKHLMVSVSHLQMLYPRQGGSRFGQTNIRHTQNCCPTHTKLLLDPIKNENDEYFV